MLKSCQYCGKIHDNKVVCGKKPKKQYKRGEDTLSRGIRRSIRWTKKSIAIRERDDYRCQVCARGLHKTLRVLNTDEVEVHHIIPIIEAPERAFDDTNLISVCEYHHKLADRKLISARELMEIAQEQCEKY